MDWTGRTENAFWAACGLFAGFGAIALALPYQLSYAEGYMLEQAVRLAGGGPLYREGIGPPWVLDNFPPLWITVLAAGAKLFGPSFAWGRALTMLATAGLTALLIAFQHRRGDPRWSALGVAGIWVLSPFVLWRSYLARMDLPALAMAALGVWAYLSIRRSRTGLPVASLLFAAAALSRQTMLVVPAAMTIALWSLGRRRHALTIAGTTAAIIAVAVLALQWMTDGSFLRHVVWYNTGRYSVDKLMTQTGRLVAGHLPLLVPGAVGVALAVRSQDVRSRVLGVWAIAEALASFTVGKPGAAANHYLPLLFVAALHAGPGIQAIAARLRDLKAARTGAGQGLRMGATMARARPLAVLLLVQALVLVGPAAYMASHAIAAQDEEAHLVSVLSGTPGPVLSENAGAAIHAGHDVVLEPRLLLEQHAVGRWDDDALVHAISAQEFTVVVTETFAPRRAAEEGFRFTEDAWLALQEHYERDEQIGKWQVWRPA